MENITQRLFSRLLVLRAQIYYLRKRKEIKSKGRVLAEVKIFHCISAKQCCPPFLCTFKNLHLKSSEAEGFAQEGTINGAKKT